jgi:hypothetical protein
MIKLVKTVKALTHQESGIDLPAAEIVQVRCVESDRIMAQVVRVVEEYGEFPLYPDEYSELVILEEEQLKAYQKAVAMLRTVLDQVDYTSGACRVNEMVGAVLPKEVIALSKAALTAITELDAVQHQTVRDDETKDE